LYENTLQQGFLYLLERRKEVMGGESGEEGQACMKKWNWFQRWGEVLYWKEQSVIFREEVVCVRANVTKEDEQELLSVWRETRLRRWVG